MNDRRSTKPTGYLQWLRLEFLAWLCLCADAIIVYWAPQAWDTGKIFRGFVLLVLISGILAQSKKMACYAAAVLVISWDACDLFALLYRAFVLVGDTVLAAVFCVEHGISVAGRGKTALERASQTILRGNGIRNRRNQTAVAE